MHFSKAISIVHHSFFPQGSIIVLLKAQEKKIVSKLSKHFTGL
jgi:hypothetical protein